MDGFSDLTGLEKVFQILTTIGGRPGALGELKDAETMRKLRRFQLEDLMRTRQEGERPASIPRITQKEMPSAGLEHLPSGEPPAYDFPTAYRKEMGVERVPVAGMTEREIKPHLEYLHQALREKDKSYAINKEGQTMVYSRGEALPPGYTPIEHQFKGESDEAIQHVSNPWQDESGNLWVSKTYKSGRTVHEPAMVSGTEPTPLPITPGMKFESKEGPTVKPTLKQLKGKQAEKRTVWPTGEEAIVEGKKRVPKGYQVTAKPTIGGYVYDYVQTPASERPPKVQAQYESWEKTIDRRFKQIGAKYRLSDTDSIELSNMAPAQVLATLMSKKGLSQETAEQYLFEINDLYKIREDGLSDIERGKDPFPRLKTIGKILEQKPEEGKKKIIRYDGKGNRIQ